jgi:hypothetical protein
MFLSSYWVTIKTKPAMPSKKFHLTAQDEEDLKQGVLHDMTNRQTDK